MTRGSPLPLESKTLDVAIEEYCCAEVGLGGSTVGSDGTYKEADTSASAYLFFAVSINVSPGRYFSSHLWWSAV